VHRVFLVATSVLTFKLFWDIDIMKITYTHLEQGLIESSQNNSLRWVCLKKRLETFTNTTPVFKCKDYFNDFVVHRHMKKVFRMYGMDSNQAKFDRKGGMWILLANVTSYLASNIENCINTEFGPTWGIKLVYKDLEKCDVVGDTANFQSQGEVCKNYGLLYIPKEAFTNTLRISLITLLVRNCNIDHQLYNYDELIQPNIALDGQLDNARYNMLKERKYAFASEKEFVFHCGEYCNSDLEWKDYERCSVHNCGIMGFTNAFITEIGVLGYRNCSIMEDGLEEEDDDCYDEDTEECV